MARVGLAGRAAGKSAAAHSGEARGSVAAAERRGATAAAERCHVRRSLRNPSSKRTRYTRSRALHRHRRRRPQSGSFCRTQERRAVMRVEVARGAETAVERGAHLLPNLSSSLPLGLQDATFVSLPASQLVLPDTVYPALHVGWQLEPDFKSNVQVPAVPSLGALDASHAATPPCQIMLLSHLQPLPLPTLMIFSHPTPCCLPHLVTQHIPSLQPSPAALSNLHFGEQIACVILPASQLVLPDTVYPALHVGWQLEPDFSWDVQLPFAPFVGAFEASHAATPPCQMDLCSLHRPCLP